MNLSDLKTGEKGIITKVRGRGAFRKRIIEMGFVVGKQVIVVKNAPLKDPIEYNIMGYEVSLRRSEASLVEISSHKNENEGDQGYQGILELEQSLQIVKPLGGKTINVALVGNPNCGKTTLFNFASNSREKVGNYGGVTVDAKEAHFSFKGYNFNLVDLPGTYSITSYTPEELYVRDHLVNELPDVVLNVVDTSNLERNLYLTTQLIDMDLRVVMALNMWDEFIEAGDRFDYDSLGKMIGIPMLPTTGSKGTGVEAIFEKIIHVFEDNEPSVRHIHINYGNRIERSIKHIQALINKPGNEDLTCKISPRYLALKLLEEDETETKRVRECHNADEIIKASIKENNVIETLRNDKMETIITDAKYGFIEGALKETLIRSTAEQKITKSRIIDTIVTSKLLSYPIFLAVIWLIFQATFWIGDYPMQWIEASVNWLGDGLSQIIPDGMMKDLLIDGILGGVGGVIVFLPNILILFFFITVMEATGYMARVAFIVDKLMHNIGLHGKSFIPMLMGFGCNVPAIMATRTIENKNDRMVTMMIVPFMSCSARYPVFVLIISAFFDSYRGSLLFGLYMFGIFLSGIVAWTMKKTLFKANKIPFVMELPPYRVPPFRSILKQTWFKGEHYLKKMGSVILLASIVIWALGYFPRGVEVDQLMDKKIAEIELAYDIQSGVEGVSEEDKIQLSENKNMEVHALNQTRLRLKQEQSFIGKLGKFIVPVIEPLGFDWKMGVSLIAGSAAKEIVISTMGVLYQAEIEDDQNLIGKLKEQSYKEGERAGEPVFTPLVGLSFMLFILIYFPCIAVIAAIKNESGQWRWALFLAVYTTILAWVISFAVYQVGSWLGF